MAIIVENYRRKNDFVSFAFCLELVGNVFANYYENPMFACLTILFVAMKLEIRFLQAYLFVKTFLLFIEYSYWKQRNPGGKGVLHSNLMMEQGIP